MAHGSVANAVAVPVWLLTLVVSSALALAGLTATTLINIHSQQQVMLSKLAELPDISARLRQLELAQAASQGHVRQGAPR